VTYLSPSPNLRLIGFGSAYFNGLTSTDLLVTLSDGGWISVVFLFRGAIQNRITFFVPIYLWVIAPVRLTCQPNFDRSERVNVQNSKTLSRITGDG
jgi:hypothetical protein